jgi:hypothetical protein
MAAERKQKTMLFDAVRIRAAATRPHTSLALAGVLSLSIAACSAPPGSDNGVDGVPDFGGTAGSTAPGGTAPAPPGNTGGANNGVTPTGSGEQNPASNAPIAGASTGGTNNGAGGGSATGGTNPGAAGSSMGAAGAGMGLAGTTGTDPATQPPVAPGDPSPAEIATFFAGLPCGAKYTALGDGGWQFCLRLADGGAACSRGTAEFQRVTFAGGGPVTNVAQVSGQRDSGVAVVTLDGALHIGGVTSIGTTPLIASGVVNYSGGFHASVALVEQGDGFGVSSWTDNGTPTAVTLPGGAQPIQVSANYGLACALSTAGEAYCWNAGGNHSLPLTDAPTRMPLARALQSVSVGQNSVCGVSFDGTFECQAAWYDTPFLPTEGAAPNFQLRQSTFPAVREVHVGFGQGIVVRADGTAVYLGGGVVPPADNPGQPFTGVTNVVAAGGDRGSACVQNAAGAVFCRTGAASIAPATLDGAPLTAQAATCPLL